MSQHLFRSLRMCLANSQYLSSYCQFLELSGFFDMHKCTCNFLSLHFTSLMLRIWAPLSEWPYVSVLHLFLQTLHFIHIIPPSMTMGWGRALLAQKVLAPNFVLPCLFVACPLWAVNCSANVFCSLPLVGREVLCPIL